MPTPPRRPTTAALAAVRAYIDRHFTEFYGMEAIMKDGVGNWFSMTRHKPAP